MNWFRLFWQALNTPQAAPGARNSPEFQGALNNFTPRAQQVLMLARKEADRFNHNFVGTEHLLLGIIRLGQGTAVNVLGKMGLDLEALRQEVERQVGTGPDQKMIGAIPYTPRVKKVLALAAKEAKSLGHTYVGTEHVLLGLLREGDGVAARVLINLGVEAEATRHEILKELDPNFTPEPVGVAEPSKPSEGKVHVDFPSPGPSPSGPPPPREAIDLSKRYDVYCHEGDRVVVHENVLFKNVRMLFKRGAYDFIAEYLEIEQANGRTMFIARSSVTRFCEHVATSDSPSTPGQNPA